MTDDLYADFMETVSDDRLRILYEMATGSLSLQPEIRLIRARFAKAWEDAEARSVSDVELARLNVDHWLGVLIKAIKADRGGGAESTAAGTLFQAGEMVVAGERGELPVQELTVVEAEVATAGPAPVVERGEQLVSIDEAARVVGRHRRSIERHIRSGALAFAVTAMDKRKRLVSLSQLRQVLADAEERKKGFGRKS